MKHIVSYSGGKDSTYMLLRMLEKNMPVDDIIFADTGMEFPELYEYMEKIETYTGRKITRLKSEKTWDDIFFRKRVRGKFIGERILFPLISKCEYNSELKLRPIREYKKNLGTECISYIGIAYNEQKRYKRLKNNEKAPLYDWRITEKHVLNALRRMGLHNPLYDTFERLGCYTCPNMNFKELRLMRKRYPKEYARLLWYGEQAEKYASSRRRAEYKPGWTLSELERKFQNEEDVQSKFRLF